MGQGNEHEYTILENGDGIDERGRTRLFGHPRADPQRLSRARDDARRGGTGHRDRRQPHPGARGSGPVAGRGWIHIYPKRGAIVQGIDERTVSELADARYVLETTAVERASEPMRQRLAEKLGALITQHRAAFTEGDVARFIELTLEFHRGFVEAGDNRVMLEMYSLLSDRHRFTLFMNSRHLLERSDELIAEHEALVKHLRLGDSAAFAATLQSHIAENAGPASPR